MVKRYQFGMPIETGAVLDKPVLEKKGFEEYFSILEDGFFRQLEQEEIVYGLGETVRGINKRGWIYESYCADDPSHSEDKYSLYGVHNFILLSGKTCKGYFFDTPGSVTFDIGYTDGDLLQIRFKDFDVEVYVIEAGSEDGVVEEFRQLIGRSYIPPRWAFGYGQSRWSYLNSQVVREVAEEYRKADLPIDSIYLDIDYMERFKDFTVNQDSFGDIDLLIREMKEKKIHLVPIIDAGVKIEEGYDVYQEGKEKGYFCQDESGECFVVGVWPGKCLFPDVLNKDARKWFGMKYQRLLSRGIDGFWNDMNEPAIFYSEKRLKKVFERIEELKQENLDVGTYFELTDLVRGTSNNREDHASFYHRSTLEAEVKNGTSEVGEEAPVQVYRHDKVHNLYGFYMTKAASEAFDELCPEKRILMFSRASYIGMHRYGGIWQGDNMSWWSHLLLNIKMMPSLNMCGFLYTGADLGGFGGNVTEELLIRWLSFGIFTPLMRNHSSAGTRQQELYLFSKKEEIKGVMKMRYRLIPYLYSEFMKAALKGTMMFRPLSFVYKDDLIARQTEDELLLGEEILIAPVYEQNQVGRTVYLPERMKLLRFRDGELFEEQIMEKGISFLSVPLGDICIFLREGHKLPLAASAGNVEDIDYDHLTVLEYGEDCENYLYYMDDGETKEYSLEKYTKRL